MARKRSASRTVSFTRSVKRDKIPGRTRGGPPKAGPDYVRLFKRLRRLELALVKSLSGKPKDFSLERFVDSVLQLKHDAALDESRSSDEGSAVPIPYEGAPFGES